MSFLLRTVGYILLTTGGLVVALNLYISFVRYPLHLALGSTRDCYRRVSGMPVVGSTLLLLIALCALPRSRLTTVAAGLIALDTGGLFWFGLVFWWWLRRRRSGGGP